MNYGLFSVYDNTTDRMIACGTWDEVEDYYECEGRYTIVHRATGRIID